MAEVVSAIASAMTSAVVSKFSSWWSGRSDATTQTTQRQPQRVENTLGLSMRWEGAHKCVGGAQRISIVCGMLSGACSFVSMMSLINYRTHLGQGLKVTV